MLLENKNKHERDDLINFDESSHTYTWKDETFISVTTWINSFFPKFDSNKVIDNMMKSSNWKRNPLFGKTKQEILENWSLKNSNAIIEGTKLHRDIELYLNDEKIDNDTIEFNYFLNFVKDHYYLEPFRTEWKIFIEEFKTAGTIDMVYRKNNGKIDLYDWKRCKQINVQNIYRKFASIPFLSYLPDTNYMHYCLQLNIYKYIVEQKYSYLVENMFLVCLHPDNKNKNYLIYPVPEMKKEVDLIFKHIKLQNN